MEHLPTEMTPVLPPPMRLPAAPPIASPRTPPGSGDAAARHQTIPPSRTSTSGAHSPPPTLPLVPRAAARPPAPHCARPAPVELSVTPVAAGEIKPTV
uniref:Uncharacterized protein n=1 Tax=Arundo donax TaxID=35708 RepID=A0A0A8YIQ3_ARUDO